ncbi:hypothetical protein G9A89_002593 [Geosiphon pyriformis]|nr:hypothetical protein G9A89_002593 [Geosiphon pyriformis]
MEKTAKVSGSNNGFRSVLLRKKRKNKVLEDSSDDVNIGSKSDSINIKEECLVKKTSFDYGKSNALARKINFSIGSDNNDILSDASLELLLPLKNLVDVSVRKSFTLRKSQKFFERSLVGLSIAIIKKIAKESAADGNFKPVLLKKKRKDVALKESIGGRKVSIKVPSGHSWGSETGDTTKSESIDMKEKCLVEETSFDYSKSRTFADKDYDQMPKGPDVKTKKALGKPLGKIDFSSRDNDDNVFLDVPLDFLSPLKNFVSVSVKKFFVLDIGLDKVKLLVVKRLFSKVNGFGKAFTPSKFSGIICASFTSKTSLAQAMEKTRAVDILVNTDLKKSNIYLDWAVVVKKIPVGTSAEAVHATLSEFGIIKLIKILVELWQKAVMEFEQLDYANLVAVKWFILIRKNAMHVARANSDKKSWNARDHHRALLYILSMETNAYNIWDFVRSVVIYAQVRCTIVCFDSVMRTILVLRSINLYWSNLMSAKCTKYEKTGHTSLNCTKIVCPVFFDSLSWAKVAGRFSFPPLSGQVVLLNIGFSSEIKPSLLVVTKINNRFAALEHSFASLAEHFSSLALDNQEADIIMSESLGVVTGNETVVRVVIFNSSVIEKMEDTLRNFAIMFLLLSFFNDGASVEFEGVCVFTSGLDKDFLSAGVAIIINNSLAYHVSKIKEVPGQVISVQLLFKGKLLVTVLGLYTGASSKTRFGQALEVNSVIAKAVNSSTFVVLGGDFNENESDANGPKWIEFRDCLSAKLLAVADEFFDAKNHGNVDAMNKFSSKFFGLKLLIAKIVKKFGLGDLSEVNHLMRTWSTLDSVKARAFTDLIDLGEKSEHDQEHFGLAFLQSSLDHLVMDNELILESEKVKLNVDRIMKSWTRKQTVFLVILDFWAYQYAPLDYVQNYVFSSVMSVVTLSELLLVVDGLPNGKAANLSGIPNEL